MKTKYSKEPFEGYTHRFIVKFSVDENWRNDRNITIYTNSGSHSALTQFIEEKKTDKVLSYVTVHTATKEQDDMDTKFIEETLKDL